MEVASVDLRFVVRSAHSPLDELAALARQVPEWLAGHLGAGLPRLRVDARRCGDLVEIRVVEHVVPHRDAPSLTPRQHEVLRLLERGLTTKEIAAELGISRFTVNNHVRAILGALGASSRSGAIYEARRLNLL